MNRKTSKTYLGQAIAASIVAAAALSACSSEPYRTPDNSAAAMNDERYEVRASSGDLVERRGATRALVLGSEARATPHIVEGEFIGRQAASALNPACVGFIDEDPSFEFEITGDEQVATLIKVTEAAGIDAVLFIEGPDGSYCADDGGDGLLPRLDETLAPGRYVAYVGSYTQYQGARYKAEVSRARPKFQVSDCRPEQTIRIGPGFQMQRIEGFFESVSRDCRGAFGIECSGLFPDEVATCIEVTGAVPASIRLTSAPFDSVMVLQSGSDSPTLYDDDSGANSNSEIMTVLQPGTYALHVGGYGSDARGPWTGEIRPVNITLNANGEIEPQPAESCRELPADETLSFIGTAKPEIACSMLFPNRECSGSVPTIASHCIVVTESASVRVSITEGGFDSVMVVTGEDVFLYNDDSDEGLLSTIDSPLPAGRYQIFVGSLNATDAAPYRLEVTSERGVGQ